MTKNCFSLLEIQASPSPAGIWLDCSPGTQKTLIGILARQWWTVKTKVKNLIVLF